LIVAGADDRAEALGDATCGDGALRVIRALVTDGANAVALGLSVAGANLIGAGGQEEEGKEEGK
jgi:hypothetical protein